jgi:hypothetical protein
MSCYSGKTLWTTPGARSQRMLEDIKKRSVHTCFHQERL